MKLYVVALGVLVTVLTFTPASGFARQETNNQPAPSGKKDAPRTEKKNARGRPAVGKVAAIDPEEKTVTVGDKVLHVTPETRIRKNNKPATLEDGLVGEEIGYFVQEQDGKQMAISIRFGPPVPRTPAAPKKETAPAESEKKPE
jgi:hypothetical protein